MRVFFIPWGHVSNHAQIWAFVTSISHMGQMRDSDWSREILLRSDWSGPRVAPYTTISPAFQAQWSVGIKNLQLIPSASEVGKIKELVSHQICQ